MRSGEIVGCVRVWLHYEHHYYCVTFCEEEILLSSTRGATRDRRRRAGARNLLNAGASEHTPTAPHLDSDIPALVLTTDDQDD